MSRKITGILRLDQFWTMRSVLLLPNQSSSVVSSALPQSFRSVSLSAEPQKMDAPDGLARPFVVIAFTTTF